MFAVLTNPNAFITNGAKVAGFMFSFDEKYTGLLDDAFSTPTLGKPVGVIIRSSLKSSTLL
jgi:hypothetical protein